MQQASWYHLPVLRLLLCRDHESSCLFVYESQVIVDVEFSQNPMQLPIIVELS